LIIVIYNKQFVKYFKGNVYNENKNNKNQSYTI